MRLAIRAIRKPVQDIPWKRWPILKTYATPLQLSKIEQLRKTFPDLLVVPHAIARFPGTKKPTGPIHATFALVALTKDRAVWISPRGKIATATPPYPFCRGNPTIGHCVAAGSCRRDPSCGN